MESYGVIHGTIDREYIYIEQIKSVLPVDDKGYIDYVELNGRMWSAEANRIIQFNPETSEKLFGNYYRLDNPYYQED